MESHSVQLHSSRLVENTLKFKTEDVCLEQKYFQSKKFVFTILLILAKRSGPERATLLLGLRNRK